MRIETPAEKRRREDNLRHAISDRDATLRRIDVVQDRIIGLEDDLRVLYAELEDDHASVSRYITRTQ